MARGAVAARWRGWSRGSPRPPKVAGRRRHIPPGSARRDSRLRSAPRRIGRDSRAPASSLRQYSPGKRAQSFATSSRISLCGSAGGGWCMRGLPNCRVLLRRRFRGAQGTTGNTGQTFEPRARCWRGMRRPSPVGQDGRRSPAGGSSDRAPLIMAAPELTLGAPGQAVARPALAWRRAGQAETDVMSGCPCRSCCGAGAEIRWIVVPGTAARGPTTGGRPGSAPLVDEPCRIEPAVAKDRMAQAPHIGMPGVSDHAWTRAAIAASSTLPARQRSRRPRSRLRNRRHIRLRQAPPAGRQLVAEEGCGGAGFQNDSLARVQRKPPPRQPRRDALTPIRQHRRIVVEQSEIVYVTQIGRAQHLGDEMIQAVEEQIGEELAGQVADGQAAAARERVNRSSPG